MLRVLQHQVNLVAAAAAGDDACDVAQEWDQHRQRVRTDVPQRAFLLAPRRAAEWIALDINRGRGLRATALPATLLLHSPHPLGRLGYEASGEEHDGCDSRRVDGGFQSPRLAHGGGQRLFQQQVLARSGRLNRDAGLDLGRDGERQRIHLLQERVEVRERLGLQLIGRLGGAFRVPAPDADEISVGMTSGTRAVDAPGPVTGSNYSNAHRGASSLAVCGLDSRLKLQKVVRPGFRAHTETQFPSSSRKCYGPRAYHRSYGCVRLRF
jgi:hypothetical protein